MKLNDFFGQFFSKHLRQSGKNGMMTGKLRRRLKAHPKFHDKT